MTTFRVSGINSATFGGAVPLISRSVRAACLATGLVLSSTAAFADPVRTVTGVVWTGNYDTGFNLYGTDFEAHVSQWLEPIANCAPCTPGSAFDLSATLAVRDWAAGRATIDGQTYDSVFYSGLFDFDADSVIVPDMPPGQSGPDAQGLSRAFTTFMFTGTLAGFADPGLTGTPLFSTELRGAGVVRAAFSNYPPETGIRILQLDYHLDNSEPVPEPGSMLLFGTGVAWVAARWRKRRQDWRDQSIV